ncbi:hypothetical protein ARTHROSP310_14140 [Arthrobacter sp. AD-310]
MPAYKVRAYLALRAERRLPARARLLTVGAGDAAAWSKKLARPVTSVANGAESAPRYRGKRNSPVVCFVGSLNYGPNIDSAHVLVKKIAPMVWEHVPDAKFVVAGRQPADSVLALSADQVEVLANVPSVMDVFNGSDVAVFPDEHGVGIRNSVREALAANVPVVATPVAAREQAPHPLLTIEKDPTQFVDQVVNHLNGGPPRLMSDTGSEVRTWTQTAADYLDQIHLAVNDWHLKEGKTP